MASATYEIRVAGSLGPAAQEAFGDLAVGTEPAETVLSGELDQAALHGLLERVRTLGLELVDIRRVSPKHSN
jgi:hypothetical protein